MWIKNTCCCCRAIISQQWAKKGEVLETSQSRADYSFTASGKKSQVKKVRWSKGKKYRRRFVEKARQRSRAAPLNGQTSNRRFEGRARTPRGLRIRRVKNAGQPRVEPSPLGRGRAPYISVAGLALPSASASKTPASQRIRMWCKGRAARRKSLVSCVRSFARIKRGDEKSRKKRGGQACTEIK